MGFPKDKHTAFDELLDSVYGTAIQRNSYLINRYREIYGLPFFEKDYETDPALFAHATRSVNFVLVALYNREKKFLMVYSSTILGANNPVGWRLLGGPIYDDRESIEETVNRIVRKETGLDVAELQPVAALENRFHCGETTIVHRGLAFLVKPVADFVSFNTRQDANGRSDHDLQHLKSVLAARRYKFVSECEVEKEMAFLNREALLAAMEVLKHKFFETPMDEVEAAKRHLVTRAFHRFVFKPVTRRSSRILKDRIISHVPTAKSILDVSAGDDELILDLATKHAPEVCVSNDISWGAMSSIRAKAKARGLTILFTNHNLTDLPFNYIFDAVLFKNTLHHLHNKEELQAILRTLKRLARRLLIVDIENPKKGSWSARLLNQYYERCYGDADDHEHHFLTMDKFKTLVEFAFDDVGMLGRIAFDSVETVKGRYMIAVIDVI